MSRFAALLAHCLCCAPIAMASNPDQWTGATTQKKVTATQITPIAKVVHRNALGGILGDSRSNVMQAPHFMMFNAQSASLRKPMPNQVPPPLEELP